MAACLVRRFRATVRPLPQIRQVCDACWRSFAFAEAVSFTVRRSAVTAGLLRYRKDSLSPSAAPPQLSLLLGCRLEFPVACRCSFTWLQPSRRSSVGVVTTPVLSIAPSKFGLNSPFPLRHVLLGLAEPSARGRCVYPPFSFPGRLAKQDLADCASNVSFFSNSPPCEAGVGDPWSSCQPCAAFSAALRL